MRHLNPLARPWAGEFRNLCLMSVSPEIYPDVRQLLRRRGWRLYFTDRETRSYIFRQAEPWVSQARQVDGILTTLPTGGVHFKYNVIR